MKTPALAVLKALVPQAAAVPHPAPLKDVEPPRYGHGQGPYHRLGAFRASVEAAYDALRAAIAAHEAIEVNGRDYIGRPDALADAVAADRSRAAKLQSVLDELDSILAA